MVEINFNTIESLIISNPDMMRVLPTNLASYVEQYKMGKQFSVLRHIGKQALFDLVNSLDEESVQILEDYFGERVIVEKLHYNTVRNVKVPLSEIQTACEELCDIRGFYYYSTWRDEGYLYISLWR